MNRDDDEVRVMPDLPPAGDLRGGDEAGDLRPLVQPDLPVGLGDKPPRAAFAAASLTTPAGISRASRLIEREMATRLDGTFRATFQPRGDSFVVWWQTVSGRRAEFDTDRAAFEHGSAPYGQLSVYLRHRVSLQEVR